MPRCARPRRPPALRPMIDLPPVTPAALAAFARREDRRLVVPAAELAETIARTLGRIRAEVAAERLPAPTETLRWIDAGTETAGQLLALLGDVRAVAALVPGLAEQDLAAVERIRGALVGVRWQHLARAITDAGGRPKTGGAEARAELMRLARDAFDPPLRGDAARRFARMILGTGAARNRGQDARSFGCAARADLPA